jgi:hypothetical protein
VETTNEYKEEDGYIVETKTTALSNTLILYKDGPTVAYRNHAIGLNTTVLEEQSLLTVVPYTGKSKLRFKTSNAGPMITLDLALGTITGLIINGGGWSETTSGELIPPVDIGGGSSPATVYFEELEQIGTPPVFIIAGSADDYIS